MIETEAPLSQTQVVVQGIKQMIVEGSLGPGARLPIEKELATALGVSRGSLREGVRALVTLGVLDTRQGAGTYVTSLDASLLTAPVSFIVDLQSADSALDLHVVRRTLETQAASLSAARVDGESIASIEAALEDMRKAADEADHEAMLDADMRFHRAIAVGSGNPVLAALIESLTALTVRDRLWRAIVDDRAEQTTIAEHAAILRALRDRSPERAAMRMANHLLQVEEFLAASA
ncbi:MAG: FadR/GntR family transcriptional regulator [Rhodococcus sp. (in: high G+C Gram-positive bacteria)]